MYESYFGLAEKPFSIAPDPDYLYMSTRHKEAMAHLSYGVMEAGGFALLTGEVGTGKTTLCRNLLMDLPKNVNLALILNPNINEIELLETICDELKIKYTPKIHNLMASAPETSQKQLLDLINKHLLKAFSKNKHTVLIIDEAQLLSRDVLELVRLLTNLETNKTKLLQIILIGQPELNEMLARVDLRQLSQRVTARYHLRSLDRSEIGEYINCRLTKAGSKYPLFSRQSLSKIYQYTKGTPRLINVLCHHALLKAYSTNRKSVDSKIIKQVAKEVLPDHQTELFNLGFNWRKYIPSALIVASVALLYILGMSFIKADKANKFDTVEKHSTLQPEQNIKNSISEEKLIAKPESDEKKTDGAVKIAIQQPDVDEHLQESDKKQVGNLINTQMKPEADVRSLVSILQQSKDKLGRIQLARQLAGLWNVDLPDEIFDPLCKEIQKHQLDCVTLNKADWQELINYNRPVLLELKDAEHVLLTGLDEKNVQLMIEGEKLYVAAADLLDYWSGKALLFWKPTELGKQKLSIGETSSDVVWLRVTLNQILQKQNMPLLTSTVSAEYDDEMVQKISLLQEENNLKADGIVGIQTYMLFNELLYSEQIPILK